MNNFTLTAKEVKHLKQLHKKQRDRRLAYRINAIILLGTGWTLTQVSEALLLDTETLRSYINKYREGKIDKILELNYKGSESRLTDEQKMELKEHLIEYTHTEVNSIIAYVKKKYGVTYEGTGMRSILSKLGFVYKKPKLIPNNSDPPASAGSRDAKRDFQVPLSPSSSALVCPPAADGLGRPAFATSDDAAPTNGSTAVRAGCCARQPLPSEGSSSSLTSSVETMKYLQRYEEIRRRGLPLYFMDGVHPQHNSRPSHGWILKGETKALLANTGRNRLNINGALNIDSKEIIVNIDEAVNAQSTIVLFEKIMSRHKSDKKIYIVCDNAGYYRSSLVKDFLEKKKKIELVYLPPYSPFLNLIERVWKYFNKKVLYNQYDEKFSDFKKACLSFFRKKHKRVLDKKLIEKFHISDKNISKLVLAT